MGAQLSPSNVALVCPEQQLSLTCRTNQSSALRWTVILPRGNGTHQRNVFNIGDGNIQALPLEIAGRTITLNFSRQSANPLNSALSIDSTHTSLNGTRINCSIGDSSTTTVIYVIDSK